MPGLSVAVGIASANRPEILHETLLSVQRQSIRPKEIVICVPQPSDCLAQTAVLPGVKVISAPRSLPIQRNIILETIAPGTDIVAFFDDDVELDAQYLANALSFLRERPDVVAFSAKAIADGFVSGEISRDAAIKMLNLIPRPASFEVKERTGLHGHNMVVRLAAAQAVRFDTRLRLYALFEDVDFGERCRKYGRVVSMNSCLLVHLATRSGRVSPRKMGYAQVTNPLYLLGKPEVSKGYMLRLLRNVILANVAGLIIKRRGRSRAERFGQLSGNITALRDYVVRGAHPERIEEVG